MEFAQILKTIINKKWILFWLAVLGAVFAFNLVVIGQPQYKAGSRVLVVQSQVAGQDIYSVSKSAQYLSKIIREGIYSDSFFERVLASPFEVQATDFSSDIKQRRIDWQNTVRATIVRDLGIMEIDVFYPDKEKAIKINEAVISVLVQSHAFYHDSGESVSLKVLDSPFVGQNPISLNLWVGTIAGGLLGFFIGLAWFLRKNFISLVAETSSLDEIRD